MADMVLKLNIMRQCEFKLHLYNIGLNLEFQIQPYPLHSCCGKSHPFWICQTRATYINSDFNVIHAQHIVSSYHVFTSGTSLYIMPFLPCLVYPLLGHHRCTKANSSLMEKKNKTSQQCIAAVPVLFASFNPVHCGSSVKTNFNKFKNKFIALMPYTAVQ